MMLPPPAAFIESQKARVSKNAARRLEFRVRSQSATVISSNVTSNISAALLTRMSR